MKLVNLKELIRFNWQNLNRFLESKERYGKPWHGRCWLYFPQNKTINFEWNFLSRFCHSYIEFGPCGEYDLMISAAAPPISFWLSFDGFVPYKFWKDLNYNKKIGFSIHDWTMFVSILENDGCWNKEDPWWQSFSVDLSPIDLLFGKPKYHSEVLKESVVDIPMPEKSYKAKIKLCLDSWRRKGFSFLNVELYRAHIDMIEPIPKPGKGTTSYNCGEDALHGLTCQVDSIEAGIAEVVKSVLIDRRRYPL